jgi:predicted DNA-binding transcriptional regulator YafY
MHPTFDFIMEILRFGKWVEVLEPDNFKQEVNEIINKQYKKYNK